MEIIVDDKKYDFDEGVSGHDIAKQLLGSDEKNVVAIKIEGKLIDMFLPIEEDAELEFVYLNSEEGQAILRHTAAHILAHAVQTIYPTARLTIGPATADGFFYDIDFKTQISAADLEKIELEMRKIVKANFKIERKEVSRSQAIKMAKENQEPYKIELIEAIPKGEKITIYTQGEWYDICRGPHLRSTGLVKAFKLTKIAGAYWHGDEKNKMLTRIYGVAFDSKQKMEDYFVALEEAEKRDHRKLGLQQELFFMHETSPGCPYFLPRGLKLFNTLIDFWRQVHDEYNYYECSSPLINNSTLWQTSGHWDHYKDDMFLIEKDQPDVQFALKPMNCPNAMLIFKSKVRSYRDLPMRISDCDTLHRNEKSGTLHGLFRVRCFHQDDSHNFISFDQIQDEYEHLFDLAERFYKVFDIKFTPVLSTRPEKYLGEKETWDKAENILHDILTRRFGKNGYKVDEGGGAFYGPKIDLWMKDAIGRNWQTGTFQLDMQLPSRFDLTYTDKDGERKTPVVVHRVIYGSLERFIGILIEHFSGNFPFWISPTQIAIVPVGAEFAEYAVKLKEHFKKLGLRVEVDLSDSNMNNKIKHYTLLKVPYVLVVGKKEVESNSVAVRVRNGAQIFGVSVQQFTNGVIKLNENKDINLTDKF